MRVISRKTLKDHWEQDGRSDSENPLKAWFQIAQAADWESPQAVKDQYRSASFVGERVVFNIAGNRYRLVCWINYPYRIVYVRFVGTHAEYDKVEVESV